MTARGRELPLRLRDSTTEIIEEEVVCNSEGKRRLSSTTALRGVNSSRATREESDSEEELPKVQEQEIPKDTEDASVSDSEFEVIQGPSAGEEISDSDSDFSDVVKVEHEASDTYTSQPTRFASSAVDTDLAAGDSDEEWQML